MHDLEIPQQHQAKQEYEIAFYKAAARAANLVEAALAANKTSYAPFEAEQLKTALSLLAIVQGGTPESK